MEKIFEGLVKGVLSGDTVFISGKVDKHSDKAPEEKMITFTLVQAPKVASSNNKDEEAFGWESREFLKGLVLGKVVKYTVDYKSGERCVGQIFLDNKNIPIEVVRQGLAKVGNINKQNESFTKSEYYTKLQSAENEGKKNKTNSIWAEKSILEKHKRNVITFSDKDFNAKALFEKMKGKEVDAMVDHVINCSSYILYFKDFTTYVRFNPRFLAIPNQTKEPAVTKAGKAFVERLTLHKDVKVTVHSVDDNGNFVGDFVVAGPTSTAPNVVVQVLKGGYTKLFTANYPNATSDELNALRAAQQFSQKERLRIWQDYVSNDGGKGGDKPKINNGSIKTTGTVNFDGTCVQIHSGDSCSVKNKSNGEHVRLFLSHIKAPKLANANSKEPDQPWAWQAKEWLRKNLVGKQVTCQYDFTRVVSADGKEDRKMNFFSVVKYAEKEEGTDTNINSELIRLGYATFIQPRSDDENISKNLDQYVAAAQESREKKTGLQSTKSPGIYNYCDLFASNPQKKKEFAAFLVNQKNLACVVEHVIAGSRVKLRIEKNKVLIPFNLIGIKSFSNDKNNTDLYQKLSAQAIDFAIDTIYQREGTCDIIQSDRSGNYFGILNIGGENFNSVLLRNGFAVMNTSMTTNLPCLAEFKKSEETAMANKSNLWKYEGVVSLLKEGTEDFNASSVIKIEEKNVDHKFKVSEFFDFSGFYTNTVPNADLNKIEAVLDDYTTQRKTGAVLESPVRKGVLCAAKYSADEQYYRAVTMRTFKDDKYEVEFIDYGTVDECEGKDLIKLDSSIAMFQGQANICELAYLQFSDNSMKKVLEKMKTFGRDSTYVGKTVYSYASEGKTKNGLIVFNGTTKNIKDSINYDVLALGLAKLDKKKTLSVDMKDLKEAQKKAEDAGVGMWADNEQLDDNNEE